MKCLVSHSFGKKTPVPEELRRHISEKLDSLGMFSNVRLMSVEEKTGENLLCPGVISWLKEQSPDDSILVLHNKGVFCPAEDLEAVCRRHQKEGVVVLGLKKPEDHPCTLEAHHEVVAAGVMRPNGNNGWDASVSETGKALFSLECDGPGLSRLVWRCSTPCPDKATLQIFIIDSAGRETCFGPVPLQEGRLPLPGALGRQKTGNLFAITRPIETGPIDVSSAFSPEGRNWEIEHCPRRLVNLDTGEKIHGRQAFPSVYEIEPCVMAGSVSDLLRIAELLKRGETAGTPVQVDVPPRFLTLFSGCEESNSEASSPIPLTNEQRLDASLEGLAAIASSEVQNIKPEGHHSFRFSRAFSALSTYGSRLSEKRNGHGHGETPCVRVALQSDFHHPNLATPRTIDTLGEDIVAVADEKEHIHVFQKELLAGTVHHEGMTPSYFFRGGEALFACDFKKRALWSLDKEFRLRQVFAMDQLAPKFRDLMPLRGRTFQNHCILCVMDSRTKWKTLAEFDVDRPRETFRLLKTDSMLIPLLAGGDADRKLIYESLPFGVWELNGEARGPRLIARRFLHDHLQAGTRGKRFTILTFKRHFLAVDREGRTGPMEPLRPIVDIRFPHTVDASSDLEADNTFYITEESSRRIFKLSVEEKNCFRRNDRNKGGPR